MGIITNIKKRNICLDAIKGVAAIFVVFLHATFPGIYGEIIGAYALFAVPTFFLTSGYYIFKEDAGEILNSIPRKIFHLLKIIAVLYLLNVVRIIITYKFNMFAIWGWLSSEVFSIRHIIDFFVLNNSAFSGVMWFLYALVYVYIIYGVAVKLKIHKTLSRVCMAMIIVPIVNMIFGGFLPNIRWIFLALPYFSIGYFIREKMRQNNVFAFINRKRWIFIIALLVGMAITPIETFLWRDNWFFIGSNIFIAIPLFVLAITEFNWGGDNVIKFLGRLGEKYSLAIYIIHPLIIHLFKLFERTAMGRILLNEWAYPFFILIVSILCSMIVVRTFNWLKTIRLIKEEKRG